MGVQLSLYYQSSAAGNSKSLIKTYIMYSTKLRLDAVHNLLPTPILHLLQAYYQ